MTDQAFWSRWPRLSSFFFGASISAIIFYMLERRRGNCEIALKEDVKRGQEELDKAKTSIKKIQGREAQLQGEVAQQRAEKDDALLRLSHMVSAKLRDNNPNIVDLNDQFRPTKLAEIFSELYDNEWTAAYDTLEKSFEGHKIVSFLLDVVMESFVFSKAILEDNWKDTNKWYLDERFPWHQQTVRALKDGRKALLAEDCGQVEQEFMKHINGICENEELKSLLNNKSLEGYMRTCIRACLLMSACDPPVVLLCPDWLPLKERQSNTMFGAEVDGGGDDSNGKLAEDEIEKQEVQKESSIVDVQEQDGERSQLFRNQLDEEDDAPGKIQQDLDEAIPSVIIENATSGPSLRDKNTAEPNGDVLNGDKPNDENDQTDTNYLLDSDQEKSKPKEKTTESKTVSFNKELFKEFTRRGKYLQFYVWPAMLLHQDGPLLAKGVAQGTEEETPTGCGFSFRWFRQFPNA